MIKALLMDGRVVDGLVDEEAAELHYMDWKLGRIMITDRYEVIG